jgi:hypothetical protein
LYFDLIGLAILFRLYYNLIHEQIPLKVFAIYEFQLKNSLSLKFKNSNERKKLKEAVRLYIGGTVK